MRRTSGHGRTKCPGTAGPQRHIYLSIPESPWPGVHKASTQHSSSGKQAAASTSISGPQDTIRSASS